MYGKDLKFVHRRVCSIKNAVRVIPFRSQACSSLNSALYYDEPPYDAVRRRRISAVKKINRKTSINTIGNQQNNVSALRQITLVVLTTSARTSGQNDKSVPPTPENVSSALLTLRLRCRRHGGRDCPTAVLFHATFEHGLEHALALDLGLPHRGRLIVDVDRVLVVHVRPVVLGTAPVRRISFLVFHAVRLLRQYRILVSPSRQPFRVARRGRGCLVDRPLPSRPLVRAQTGGGLPLRHSDRAQESRAQIVDRVHVTVAQFSGGRTRRARGRRALIGRRGARTT